MGAIISGSINLSKLNKDRLYKGKDGSTYYNFDCYINDETGKYGHNVSLADHQDKEEREKKNPRNYTGNGRVVWTDGNIVVAEKMEQQPLAASTEEDDLPF